MKWFFLLLCVALSAPVWAEPAPIEEPLLSVYSTDRNENSRRAIRLGYQNFRSRVNTKHMTPEDTDIAQLIQKGFQPFFEKLNRLETLPTQQRAHLSPELNDEFEKLVIQFAKLLFKNQYRYTNPYFLDDQAAVQETVAIVQEAVDNGSF